MAYELSEAKAIAVIATIRSKIQQYFAANHLKYAVLGKSEGLDSSVIAGLVAGIEGIQPIGVIMPAESKPEAETIAREVLEHFQIPALKIDLTQAFVQIKELLRAPNQLEDQLTNVVRMLGDHKALERMETRRPIAYGNIKVRLRMVTLYHLAQLLQGVVMSTDNFSEYWMGFWTINGDVGDIAPIQQIFKGNELYTIGKVLGVPVSSLNAIPSDGLGVTRNSYDHEQLGMQYRDLDQVIVGMLKGEYQSETESMRADMVEKLSEQLQLPSAAVKSVGNRLLATEFKRHWPVVFTREELGLPPVGEL